MPGSLSTPTTTSAAGRRSSSRLEILDDTLIYYIIGDNGASAEGTHNGTFNEMINFNGAAALETPDYVMANLDKWGGRDSYPHYAVGWAHAMDTPYQWTKQIASHWGGTRNGTIVHWPAGIKAKGEVRNQFHHVIDVAPTILEAAGSRSQPSSRACSNRRWKATSMLYSFNDGSATRPAHHPVLRDVRQPRRLRRWLDGGHPPLHSVGAHRGIGPVQ